MGIDGSIAEYVVKARVRFDARKLVRLSAIVMAAASLAACAQTTVSQRSDLRASRVASLEQDRPAASVTRTRVATRKHTPLASRRGAGEKKIASQGIASFYSQGQPTASGERFDARELTAAHPTLPFGTKLLVTNVDTGRSVTVRVNDRGPFVQGRVVDVSYSAAQSLGMVGKGLANVRLDVVQ
ncbi:septal ring lytic transglycosylase RlpA family protein [Bradyrhizobium jicamae]|uniref:septal ring lytic transglycosylase RlpA family protein n=1 Tax=Bradyrhizobium jicamae TaxID=280332 RepID=UPI001BA74D96|nr:septal ring lytic transglycosylase RlpA family protein [Bradyrhizobium jicamae]MBR0757814.1 septal ring lytic transglycosylase RlpA family protein [Bradyrhizobium jicamae]